MYCTLHRQECVHISIEIDINTTDTTIIIWYCILLQNVGV